MGARLSGSGPLLVRIGPQLLTGYEKAITVRIPLTGYSRARNRCSRFPRRRYARRPRYRQRGCLFVIRVLPVFFLPPPSWTGGTRHRRVVDHVRC